MNREEAIENAEHAKRILEDELVQKALSSIRLAVQQQLWSSAVSGKIDERLNAMAWATDQFERAFVLVINGGKIAENEIMTVENMRVRAKAAQEQAQRVLRG